MKLVIIDIYFPIKWFRGALKIQIFQKVKTLTDPALPPHPPMAGRESRDKETGEFVKNC